MEQHTLPQTCSPAILLPMAVARVSETILEPMLCGRGTLCWGFADGDWSRILPVLDVPAVMLRKLDFKPRCSTAAEELVSSGLLSHKCFSFPLDSVIVVKLLQHVT